MNPWTDKSCSAINHTGHYTLCLQDSFPRKNERQCEFCSYYSGCSCICHQSFTLRYRFMTIDAEEKLFNDVKAIIDPHFLPCPSKPLNKRDSGYNLYAFQQKEEDLYSESSPQNMVSLNLIFLAFSPLSS